MSEKTLLMLFISWDSSRHRGGKKSKLLKPANIMKCRSDNVLETDMQFKEKKQNSSSYRNTKIVRNASLFGHLF